MITLGKILVPTDFSENGQWALKYAAALAEKFNSELHLLHVLQNVFPQYAPEPGVIFASTGDFEKELRAAAQASLQKVADSDLVKGKKSVQKIREGQPFVEIVKYAREELIDLIVLGTHGRTGLVHVLLGSVAERVVQKAGCPVLTVRPEGHQFVMP